MPPKKWKYAAVHIKGDTDTDIWYCYMEKGNQENLETYLSSEFLTNVKEEDLLCFHEKTKGKQKFAERLLRFIESIGGVTYNSHKKMSVDFILNDMDERMLRPHWHEGSKLDLPFVFAFPVDTQKLNSIKYPCYLELYPSTQLKNFKRDKKDFLNVIQVGSDEFAYDYEEEITKAAKNIFGEDIVETAIYDFGGDDDYVDFKILISLWTKNLDEKEHHYYFINRSNKSLPEKVSVQNCIEMQDYSTNLVKQLYDVYTEE